MKHPLSRILGHSLIPITATNEHEVGVMTIRGILEGPEYLQERSLRKTRLEIEETTNVLRILTAGEI
jgi:hypothetical protein